MKLLRGFYWGVLTLALRMVLGFTLFAIGMVLLSFHVQCLLSKEGGMDRELRMYLKWVGIVALAIIAGQMLGL